MAADIKEKFGSNGQTITCSIASVTNGNSRQSTVVDNGTNLFTDALVQVMVKTGASGTATTGFVAVFAYATVDGGTTYTDGATGSDGSFTPTSPPNAVLIGRINTPANATTYKSTPMSVAAAFNGVLPEKWGVIIQNSTGGTLDSTAGNHTVKYQGVYAQTV